MGKKLLKKFKNGKSLGLKISYVKEKKELETAGPLSLLNKNSIKDDILIINGDVIANIDFDELLRFHRTNRNDFTVCVKNYFYKIPYGLIENKNNLKIKEKPTIKNLINSGIYVCSPKVLRHLKYNNKINMTDFINYISDKKLKVRSFLIYENIYDFTDLNTYYKIYKKIMNFKNKFICIIPARGGSKGLKNKNLLKINKKPLIFWPIDAAKKVKNIKK